MINKIKAFFNQMKTVKLYYSPPMLIEPLKDVLCQEKNCTHDEGIILQGATMREEINI